MSENNWFDQDSVQSLSLYLLLEFFDHDAHLFDLTLLAFVVRAERFDLLIMDVLGIHRSKDRSELIRNIVCKLKIR